MLLAEGEKSVQCTELAKCDWNAISFLTVIIVARLSLSLLHFTVFHVHREMGTDSPSGRLSLYKNYYKTL